jgi:predicted regulator of Ras-like GTPase activity (Roadblock/LC7/MglB family)
MEKWKVTLKALGDQITGYTCGIVAGIDGTILATDAREDLDLVKAGAYMTDLLRMGGSELEDVLMTTTRHVSLIRYLPGKSHFLGVFADRKKANLGQVRLLTGIYAEKIARNLATP